MTTAEEIYGYIKEIITKYHITISNLARVSGINRTTLQKSFGGERHLNLRQFKQLLTQLPIPHGEKIELFTDYVDIFCDKDRVKRGKIIFEILNYMTECLSDDNAVVPLSAPQKVIEGVFTAMAVPEAVRGVTLSELDAHGDSLSVSLYLPFTSDFFYLNAGQFLKKDTNISILFELKKPDEINNLNNLVTFKNLVPYILNYSENCELNYIYTDNALYTGHLTAFPFYIVYNTTVVFIDFNMENVFVSHDPDLIKTTLKIHNHRKIKIARLKRSNLSVFDSLIALQAKQAYDEDLLAISYVPCISSFASPSIYMDLIEDSFPHKAEIMKIIKSRLEHIRNVNKKNCVFSLSGLKEFAENGNLLIFKHPYLKSCSIAQRIEILNNILAAVNEEDNKISIVSEEFLTLSPYYEVTNIQSYYNFDILIYHKNSGDCTLVEINEPVMSKYFADFVGDIIKAPVTFTKEETVYFIKNAIAGLEEKL